MTPSVKAGIASIILVSALAAGLRWHAARTATDVGFWFDLNPEALAFEGLNELGALTSSDLARVEDVARAELGRAFEGFDLRVTSSRQAFWRLSVVNDVGFRRRPTSAQTFAFGPLGGFGSVAFGTLASGAVRYAPPGASREVILEGVGRGIGRSAAHEIAHQITGSALHDPDDPDSYEYPDTGRASQYYGTLHWKRALPQLRARVGR